MTVSAKTTRAENDVERNEAITDVHEAAHALAEFGERVVYGAMAGGITIVALKVLFDIDPHHAAEPALLNAGLAYYTHEVTGRILRALVVIASPAVGKLNVVKGGTKIVRSKVVNDD